MINVPANIITDLASSTAQTATVLWPFILLIVSIPFAFYVVRKIITLIPKR
jgi:hypothetical protein